MVKSEHERILLSLSLEWVFLLIMIPKCEWNPTRPSDCQPLCGIYLIIIACHGKMPYTAIYVIYVICLVHASPKLANFMYMCQISSILLFYFLVE